MNRLAIEPDHVVLDDDFPGGEGIERLLNRQGVFESNVILLLQALNGRLPAGMPRVDGVRCAVNGDGQ
mgnify:CR=1 FL=1